MRGQEQGSLGKGIRVKSQEQQDQASFPDTSAKGTHLSASTGGTRRKVETWLDTFDKEETQTDSPEGILQWDDPRFPEELKAIPQPPSQLYYKGNLSLLKERKVAIVGARKSSSYGRRIAERLGSALGKAGVTVVSGLAVGVDGQSQKGALQAGGGVIGVLGCGLDIPYPRANLYLKERIAKEGLLLSEYPPGTPPRAYTFPRRNRIISGLGEVLVVVEAAVESGSLITAQLAVEQGKAVYAVPGNIDAPSSAGTNSLIRDGALPLISIGDLLQDLHLPLPGTNQDMVAALGSGERALVCLLEKEGEMTTDALCAGLQVSPGTVRGLLSVLELKGFVGMERGRAFLMR